MTNSQSHEKPENFNLQNNAVFTRFDNITQRLTNIFPNSLQSKCRTIKWKPTHVKLTSPRFGVSEAVGKENTTILNFSEELLTNRKALLDSVLWREAFLLYLPRIVRLVPEAADLGLFCYYKFGLRQSKHRQRFLQIWETISPAQDHIYYRYHPSVGFRYFDKTVDGNFLKLVLKWFAPFWQTLTPLTSEIFTANLEKWMFNYHRILKPIELKVLQGINSCPTCTQKELATQLDLQQPTTSRIIKTLAEKHLLRLLVFHNPTVMGLHPIGVIFTVSKISTLERLKRFLFQIRYLLGVQEFNNRLLAVFLIPSRRVNRFRQWLKQLAALRDLLTPSLNLVSERSISQNWGLYNPQNGGWTGDYTSIIDNFSRILDEDWTDHLPQLRLFQLSGTNVNTVKLNPEDFIYMERATNVFLLTGGPRFLEAEEARIAGYSDSEHMAYRRRVDYLQKHQLISKPFGISVFNIGLDATINFLIKSTKEDSRKILSAFQLFPHVNGMILDDGTLGITLSIPQEYAVTVETSLREAFTRFFNQISIEIKPAWQSYGQLHSNPINSFNYNFEKNSWIWTKDTLPLIKS